MHCTPYYHQYLDNCLPNTGLNLTWILAGCIITIAYGAGLLWIVRHR